MGSSTQYEHSDNAPVGKWGYQFGTRAPRVTIKERATRGPDKQPPLYAHWWVNGDDKVGPRRVREVTSVRDESGKVDKDKRQEAEDEAERIWEAVQEGTHPDVIFSEENEEDEDERTDPEKLRLQEGLDLFLDKTSGRYAGETHKKDYSNRVRQAERLRSILEDNPQWMELTPNRIKQVYVTMFEHFEDREVSGRRSTIRTVDCLKQARRWLIRNRYLHHEAPEVPDQWRRHIKNYWQSSSEEEVSVHRPSHRQAELELLAAALRDDDFEKDPRFKALMRHGIGQRLGVLGARARRMNLSLDDSGRWGQGRLVIPSAPNKQGLKLDLNEETRAMWEEILSEGYLSRLETAREDGDIDGYYLFPGHRLRNGKARIENGDKPISDGFIKGHLDALEEEVYEEYEHLKVWTEEQEEAGTMHIDGRGWHGLRRAMVKRLDERGVSPRIRNEMLGWKPGSRVPETIYTDDQDEDRAQAAAEAREEVLAELGRDRRTASDEEEVDHEVTELREEIEMAIEDDDFERAADIAQQLASVGGDGEAKE